MRPLRAVPSLGANDYTPDLTRVKFHEKMSLRIHWTLPVKIHWKSDNPLGNTAEESNPIEKCH